MTQGREKDKVVCIMGLEESKNEPQVENYENPSDMKNKENLTTKNKTFETPQNSSYGNFYKNPNNFSTKKTTLDNINNSENSFDNNISIMSGTFMKNQMYNKNYEDQQHQESYKHGISNISMNPHTRFKQNLLNQSSSNEITMKITNDKFYTKNVINGDDSDSSIEIENISALERDKYFNRIKKNKSKDPNLRKSVESQEEENEEGFILQDVEKFLSSKEIKKMNDSINQNNTCNYKESNNSSIDNFSKNNITINLCTSDQGPNLINDLSKSINQQLYHSRINQSANYDRQLKNTINDQISHFPNTLNSSISFGAVANELHKKNIKQKFNKENPTIGILTNEPENEFTNNIQTQNNEIVQLKKKVINTYKSMHMQTNNNSSVDKKSLDQNSKDDMEFSFEHDNNSFDSYFDNIAIKNRDNSVDSKQDINKEVKENKGKNVPNQKNLSLNQPIKILRKNKYARKKRRYEDLDRSQDRMQSILNNSQNNNLLNTVKNDFNSNSDYDWNSDSQSLRQIQNNTEKVKFLRAVFSLTSHINILSENCNINLPDKYNIILLAYEELQHNEHLQTQTQQLETNTINSKADMLDFHVNNQLKNIFDGKINLLKKPTSKISPLAINQIKDTKLKNTLTYAKFTKNSSKTLDKDHSLFLQTQSGNVLEYDFISNSIKKSFIQDQSAHGSICCNKSSIFCSNKNGDIVEFSVNDTKMVCKYEKVHQYFISTIIVCPKGSNTIYSGDEEGFIVKFDTLSKKAQNQRMQFFQTAVKILLISSDAKTLFAIGKLSHNLVQIDTKTLSVVKDYSDLILDEITSGVIDNNSEYVFIGDSLGNFKIISIDTKTIIKTFTNLICFDEKSLSINKSNLVEDFNDSVYDFGTGSDDEEKDEKSHFNGISIEAQCFCDNDCFMYIANEKGAIFKYSFDHFQNEMILLKKFTVNMKKREDFNIINQMLSENGEFLYYCLSDGSVKKICSKTGTLVRDYKQIIKEEIKLAKIFTYK